MQRPEVRPHLTKLLKHKRYHRRMTIAAGFRVENGVLLCADQLHVAGDGATSYSPKLVAGETSDGLCVFGFAYAGNQANAKLAIRACMKTIKRGKASGSEEMLDALSRSILAVNKNHVDCHQPSELDAERFELLIALNCVGESYTELFTTSGSTLMPVEKRYHFIGVGGAYGECVGRVMPQQEATSLEVALMLANRSLATAKRYTNDCGGPSSFTFVSKEVGCPRILHVNQPFIEEYVSEYETAMDRILLACVEDKSTDVSIAKELESLATSAGLLRFKWRSSMRALALPLRGMVPILPKRSSPQSTTTDSSPQPPSPELPGGSGES
jgi:hypothetical protein